MKTSFTPMALLISTILLTISCAPEPRSYQYFKEHPEEASRVDKMCREGTQRGEECKNAALAIPRELFVR